MSNAKAPWFKLKPEHRREEIRKRRKKNDSFAKIALDLLGSEKNKPTIWSWARRNMKDSEIYPKMRAFGIEPYGTYSDVERWTIFDILSSLFPRLDAMSEHLLVEMKNNLTDQHRNFTITAGFLDDLEKRVIEAIGKNTVVLTTRVSSAIPQTGISFPPSSPRLGVSGAPPPPPGGGGGGGSRVAVALRRYHKTPAAATSSPARIITPVGMPSVPCVPSGPCAVPGAWAIT